MCIYSCVTLSIGGPKMSGNFVRERQRIVYIYNIHKVGNLISPDEHMTYTSGFKKHLYAPIGALLTNYSFKPIGAYKCFLKPDVYDNLWHPT